VVRDVLFERINGLISARVIPYDEFQARLDSASRGPSESRRELRTARSRMEADTSPTASGHQ
ncbi:MAG: hypothetical protein KAY37_08095, partial [Phycisphaerae bacterium]|nr:hypothetical protein [Phycisphaerae bacterium]